MLNENIYLIMFLSVGGSTEITIMFFVIMFYVVFSVLYILLSDLGILPTNLFMDVVCLSSSNTLRFLQNASCKHLVLLGWAIGFRIFTYSVLSSSGFCSIYKPYKSMLAKLIAHFFFRI